MSGPFDQAAVDALLLEARGQTDPNHRSNALLRAFDGIWKRNRALFAANVDAIASFQVRRGLVCAFVSVAAGSPPCCDACIICRRMGRSM